MTGGVIREVGYIDCVAVVADAIVGWEWVVTGGPGFLRVFVAGGAGFDFHYVESLEAERALLEHFKAGPRWPRGA